MGLPNTNILKFHVGIIRNYSYIDGLAVRVMWRDAVICHHNCRYRDEGGSDANYLLTPSAAMDDACNAAGDRTGRTAIGRLAGMIPT